jgi:hypothetical protein
MKLIIEQLEQRDCPSVAYQFLDAGNNVLLSGTTPGTVLQVGTIGPDLAVNGVDTGVLESAVASATANGSNDTLDFSDGTLGTVNVTLTRSSPTSGYRGNAAVVGEFTIAFTGIGQIDGSNGDAITGVSVTSTWALAASGSTYTQNGVSFGFVGFTSIDGGAGNNTYDVFGDFNPGAIIGGGGTNTLSYADPTNTAITANIGFGSANNKGTIVNAGGTLNFSNIANLTGSTGADDYKFTPGFGLTGNLNGTGGLGTLDYSLYTTSVRVNLLTGTALTVSGTVSNIHNVTGGTGADILIGDNFGDTLSSKGNSVLVGGTGNDHLTAAGSGTTYSILISNGGTDTLDGGLSTSLMIGGKYTQSSNVTALNSLITEWDRTNETSAQKKAHLTGTPGGLNGSNVLTRATVSVNGASATLEDTVGTASVSWVSYYAVDSDVFNLSNLSHDLFTAN